MAQFDVNSTSVENIISSIKAGEIAIPEIQRPFVWDASKVRDLMDSLYKGFPVGYIIVWKNPDIRLKEGSFTPAYARRRTFASIRFAPATARTRIPTFVEETISRQIPFA